MKPAEEAKEAKKKELTEDELMLVSGGVGQETDEEESDEPACLYPTTQANIEKWVKH